MQWRVSDPARGETKRVPIAKTDLHKNGRCFGESFALNLLPHTSGLPRSVGFLLAPQSTFGVRFLRDCPLLRGTWSLAPLPYLSPCLAKGE